MIILMISFHLVYIGDSYPYAKQVVYTFHMPVFLIISGFLMNIEKPAAKFCKTIAAFLVPYIIMEGGYIVMASIVPIREPIDNLTPAVFYEKMVLHPLGPYWFLRTLMLCSIPYFLIFRYLPINRGMKCALLAIVYVLYSKAGIVALTMPTYFFAGVIVRQSNSVFTDVFRPMWLSLLFLIVLIADLQNLDARHIGGGLIVYFVTSLLLAIYPYIKGKLQCGILFIGRNTLPLFLFSPIFTILCKQMLPYLEFDNTGMIFLFLSLTICISGSLAIAWAMDKVNVSKYFFLKEKALCL
jgi:fucose 4-O-acetylase-like acetyltransferase